MVLGACARDAGGEPPLNLLLVSLDTVRADRIGAYGYALAETPALDRLASEGVRFEQAMTVAPLTLPAHASLLTGLLPRRHGLRNNGAGRLPDSVPTLATVLAERGYRTGAFVGAFVLDRRFGLERGFATYDDEIPRRPGGTSLEAERPGHEVVERALAWLAGGEGSQQAANGPADERDVSEPFFAWVHLFDAHAPYAAREPFASRHLASPYDAEVAAVDFEVGRLLAALEERDLARRTVVVVVGDHGEGLGDHGEPTHGLLLYESTLRVPLVVRAPGLVDHGWSVAEPVGLADLAPTVLGLLAPDGQQGVAPALGLVDGRDLSADLRGRREPPRVELVAETDYPSYFGWAALAAVRRGPWKYIEAPRPELYQLEDDPLERSDRWPAAPAEGRELAAQLARLHSEDAVPGAAASQSTDSDSEVVARLASLGYVVAPAASLRSGSAAAGSKDLREDPKDMVGLFQRLEEARAELEAGRLDEAIRRLEALLAEDPDNPVFQGTLGEALRRQGKAGPSVALHRRAVESAPTDAQAWYNLASSLRAAGRERDAVAALAQVLRADPRHGEALNMLGIVHAEHGRLEAARESFAGAAAVDPRNPSVFNNLGNALRALGRLDEAEDAYRRAIEIAPGYAEPWNGLGTLQVERDRPADALRYLDRALALAPDQHETRLNRAIALEMLGNLPAAREAYVDFLTASHDDPGLAEQRRLGRQLLARLEASPPPDRAGVEREGDRQ